ncbi:MAG: hypothetical protein EA398_14885 [Deltaproteobacteria bacterium]|nr:MAG: hypothetical protein EA398_14885 [Deltaproteobacteria bacterium]
MSDSGEDSRQDPHEAETWLLRVLSVADAPLRRTQVDRHLRLVEADVAALHVDALLHRAVLGDPDASEFALSLAEAVDRADEDGVLGLRVEAMNLHARRHGLHGVGWFLLDPPPARQPGDRVTATREQMREPLGVRRARASGWHPQYLERLLHDEHPLVVERLCANPRILPQHIMTVVTRRPTRAQVLRTVAREPRWFRSMDIRFAMASNPFGPTGLALRILPTLSAPLQHRLMNANDVHPAVRQAACWWLEAREGRTGPALPWREDTGRRPPSP